MMYFDSLDKMLSKLQTVHAGYFADDENNSFIALTVESMSLYSLQLY